MGFLINDQTREIKKVVALPDLEAEKDGDFSFDSFPISL